MLAHFWFAGLQGTAGHHALLHFFGLQAFTGHGMRLHTVLQLGLRGGFLGAALLPGRPPFFEGPVPAFPLLDPGSPLLLDPPPPPACVGFLRLRGPPNTLCCWDPGWGRPCSQSL